MKKIIVSLLFLVTSVIAELTQVWATPDFAEKNIKIIDIRTPAEWKETGIVKDSYTIMFFDEKGNFNVESFLKQLNMAVKKDEQFALLCRVGSRTGMVSQFLSEKLGYKVINLKGGIMKMIHDGYKTVPYKQ
ncbi:MAG TPA: rhodanese-like domain-containing protein [Epsilonproteobacteria bacterium]|nr:rhodanese-like domain-containing protein [Campylobacterota bacterium]